MDKPPIQPRPLSPEGQRALDAASARRGYLLPYHRMLAASAPGLLEAYDAFYEALTLKPRVLTPAQRETVWAALLAAVREVHGFIHMRRAAAAGMSEADIVRAVAIASVAESYGIMGFAAGSWPAWTQPETVEAAYLRQFDCAADGLDPMRAHLAAVGCHGARRERAGTILHLRHAFRHGATPEQVCEGLSYMLIPCGGNTLIEAVSYWEEAAAAGLAPGPY
jgi:alkylhydroperoxidase/carboxymuconolactone decarboxylase family protein YurZ